MGWRGWHGIASDGMGWHGIASDGMGWHGIASDGMGWREWDGMTWYCIGWHWMASNGMVLHRMASDGTTVVAWDGMALHRMASYCIGYLWKKLDYLLKNTKLWPLIVYKSKLAKPGKRYSPNMLQIRSVFCRTDVKLH